MRSAQRALPQNGSNRARISFLLIEIIVYAIIIRAAFGDGFKEVSFRLGRQGGRDNSASAYALLSCYNYHYSPQPLSFEEFLGGQISRSLRIHRVWWSKRHAKYPLGLFTHLSLSRAPMLEDQCRSFPGGLVVAAVWIPLVRTAAEIAAERGQHPHHPHHARRNLSAAHLATLRNATDVLSLLFRRMEFPDEDDAPEGDTASESDGGSSTTTCTLRILMLYELVGDERLTVLMPVNALRNTAMLAVDTPLAAMLDADLSLSLSLASHVLSNSVRASEIQRRAEEERTGWVLPAWEVNGRIELVKQAAVADAMLAVRPESKMVLWDMWVNKQMVLPFASERYKLGHNGTRYEFWFGTQTEYPVAFEEGYEPWFFGARRHLPMYDARFRGHYYDKIANVRNTVWNKNLELLVIPDVWLVHRPHGLSMQNNLYTQETGTLSPMDQPVEINGTTVHPRNAYLDAARAFYKDAVDAMNEDRYTPVVQPSVRYCRQVLPWWQGKGQQDGAATVIG